MEPNKSIFPRPLLTIRKNAKLPYDGNHFIKDKLSGDGKLQFWRCDQRGVGCRARIHTDVYTGEVVKILGVHCDHEPFTADSNSFSGKSWVTYPRMAKRKRKEVVIKKMESNVKQEDAGDYDLTEFFENLAKEKAEKADEEKKPEEASSAIVQEPQKGTEIVSIRNKKKFEYQKCLFVRDKASRDKTMQFWRCDQKNLGCRVRLHTDIEGTKVLRVIGHHVGHIPSATQVESRRIVCAAKARAMSSREKASEIISDMVESAEPSVAENLPNPEALRKQLQRAMKKRDQEEVEKVVGGEEGVDDEDEALSRKARCAILQMIALVQANNCGNQS
ncbi:hypothetical protein L596_023734 [Steinernema carpocapsae]|uniref:FLYWCH-type domain-containing protein n=1 Tax=Steinernema carpocapsae TaxID=34508 RepID=A0A4U5MEL3_STECR|nr:hypothetical protein L596_023734 [Steinernema carpocapsae]